MSRINSNVTSLLVQRTLGQNNTNLARSLERLSTGYRINRGADDPAGLVASEKLRSETKALEAAIGNAERADQIANIVEGGLQEIGGLLVEVQGLIGQNGSETGLTTEEKEANHLVRKLNLITTNSKNLSKLIIACLDLSLKLFCI